MQEVLDPFSDSSLYDDYVGAYAQERDDPEVPLSEDSLLRLEEEFAEKFMTGRNLLVALSQLA